LIDPATPTGQFFRQLIVSATLTGQFFAKLVVSATPNDQLERAATSSGLAQTRLGRM
jgi:hypothetical protein